MKKFRDYLSRKYLGNQFKKRVFYPLRVIDILDWIVIRRNNPLIPPSRLLWGGPSRSSLAFYKWGMGDLKLFVKLCNLKPDYRVLDVGCGIGRCAIPFTEFLNKNGSYEGFDSHKGAIDMCDKISLRYPNFNFKYADIYNEYYNQDGKIKPTEFKFPYESNSLDFVFLISVFTHMLSDEFTHYMTEISRVLKVGGKVFITFFILNDKSLKAMNQGRASFDFKHKLEESFIANQDRPGHAVAYDQEYLERVFNDNKIQINEINYGSWPSKDKSQPFLEGKVNIAEKFTKFQDIIIAKKK